MGDLREDHLRIPDYSYEFTRKELDIHLPEYLIREYEKIFLYATVETMIYDDFLGAAIRVGTIDVGDVYIMIFLNHSALRLDFFMEQREVEGINLKTAFPEYLEAKQAALDEFNEINDVNLGLEYTGSY
jgi:hypothetical protein